MSKTVIKSTTDRELSAEDILKSTVDLTPVRLDLPMLGGHIYMRALTGDEGVKFNDILEDPTQRKISRCHLIALSACKQDGSRLFSVSQVIELGKKSVPALNAMQDLAMKLSGFGKYSVAAALGNVSGEALPGASPTDSPAN